MWATTKRRHGFASLTIVYSPRNRDQRKRNEVRPSMLKPTAWGKGQKYFSRCANTGKFRQDNALSTRKGIVKDRNGDVSTWRHSCCTKPRLMIQTESRETQEIQEERVSRDGIASYPFPHCLSDSPTRLFSLCNDGRFRSAPLIRQGSVHNQQDYFVDSEALRRQVRQTTECWFDWLYRP